MTNANHDPVPGNSNLEARGRALDPNHMLARMVHSGWTETRDGRWRHPASGITVALPGPDEPELAYIAAVTAAMAEGRELETLITSVERAHLDRYVFAPAAGPDHPRQLPTLNQAMALMEALDELVHGAARHGHGLYGRGAAEAMDLSGEILLAPVPGEPAAVELLVPSPLEPEAPRLGPALTGALEQLADPGDQPLDFVLRAAGRSLAACAHRNGTGALAVLVIPSLMRNPRDQARALRLPAGS